jgi:hypothetical protein
MLNGDEEIKGKSFLLISNDYYFCYHVALVKKAVETCKVNMETVGRKFSYESASAN